MTLLERILAAGIIAVIRAPQANGLLESMAALARGGVTVQEVTLTVPGALDLIREAKATLGERIILGAGTVLSTADAEAALAAGAAFIVSPIVNMDVIALCKARGVPVMPGAYTPTEIVTAWNAGADVVKVFPADGLGPAYFKALRGPLPQVRLMPTGGVDLSSARAFLEAGAVCLGTGSQLLDLKLVAAGDSAALEQRAAAFAQIVADFRSVRPERAKHS
jgi:2-dehydro-3-deoxyphosphogluconate aldolase / (4S)-4-hydroxy-2-oxoglutarate aldolase